MEGGFQASAWVQQAMVSLRKLRVDSPQSLNLVQRLPDAAKVPIYVLSIIEGRCLKSRAMLQAAHKRAPLHLGRFSYLPTAHKRAPFEETLDATHCVLHIKGHLCLACGTGRECVCTQKSTLPWPKRKAAAA